MLSLFHRKTALILFATALLTTAGAQDAALPVLAVTATEDLKAKDGQRIVVFGESARSGKSPGGINFVNFKDATFTLVTFKKELARFKNGEPADVYEGKRLAVTGVISLYQGQPQIKLTDPAQVRVLGPNEAWPAQPKIAPAPPGPINQPPP